MGQQLDNFEVALINQDSGSIQTYVFVAYASV
jgi:hypothetical protein